MLQVRKFNVVIDSISTRRHIFFLGGLDVLRGISNIFDNFWADLSKLMLLFTGLTMTYLNIKSFIFARKVREESENREM